MLAWRTCPSCGRAFELPADFRPDTICEIHNADGSIDLEYLREVVINHPDRPDYSVDRVATELQGTWFTSHLYRLMLKADSFHFARLELGFPQEAREIREYLYSRIRREDEDVNR